jgi:hypothetical protein
LATISARSVSGDKVAVLVSIAAVLLMDHLGGL